MPKSVAAGVIVAALRLAACTTERPGCYPGEYVGCTCASGASGYAACEPQIAGYGTCVCDGTTPGLDASAGRPPAAPPAPPDASVEDAEAAAKHAIFEACTTNADCGTALCFTYGDRRSLCTTPCRAPSDCAPPSKSCNGMGVCAPP